MPRKVTVGLIQTHNPVSSPKAPLAKVQKAALDLHLKLLHEAGKKGVQILGLQEIFNGPYFCPSQDAKWYDAAEPVPGPTTEAIAKAAKKYRMAVVVPVYEREDAGVYYNTAAVVRRGRVYLGKYRKNHIPHTSGFWEKYFFKPGNLGYPVFQTRYAKVGVYICYDRHFPEGARALGLNGAEIVFNPSATVAGLSQYLWKLEQPAHAVANGYFVAASNRVGDRGAVEHRALLRIVVRRRSARQLPRDRQRGQGRARRRDLRPRPDRRGPPDLAVLPGPAAGDVRTARGAVRSEEPPFALFTF